MKAIIIAAGMGSRMQPLTDDLPKCLLEVQGKTLLQNQLDAFRVNDITEFSLVKGYQQEKIMVPGIRYYVNSDYKNNNILNSLMHAEQDLTDSFIASYGDIIFKPSVVNKLLNSTADISIVVDTDWKKSYEGRTQHPVTEAEKVIFDTKGQVKQIGKILETAEENCGEFIGMFMCTNKGAVVFSDKFKEAKRTYAGKPFIRAKTFEKAYLTDFFQYLTDSGVSINCVFIKQGWYEIDTAQDIERVRKLWRSEHFA